MTNSPSTALSDLAGKKTSGTTDKGLLRVQAILDAARQLLATEGYAGLTMRAVASEVGVSLSTVQHYFNNKEVLIQAVLTYVMDSYQAVVADLMNSLSQQSQFERFMVIMDMVLVETRRPETYGILTEICALANRLPFAGRLMETVFAREQKEIFRLIYGIEPTLTAQECKQRAAVMVALIHGLATQMVGKHGSALSRQQLEDAARQSFIRLATQP
ncbi:TetR/AcrR family transcriptional regulator [Limnobacter humi]|uniref:TetR/AcrR family transcriptional regulator n=1 Tax=Limnobacter humi TaxID=1778671 RepID=A0ABT1WFK6_9BURK|nr:TetR/AcrR family transcriptional regulator [Limnobacter humi]MCQ8896305.1 TetR/AcrR family transcriptional regulator [Limnobacter humi]